MMMVRGAARRQQHRLDLEQCDHVYREHLETWTRAGAASTATGAMVVLTAGGPGTLRCSR